jgi:hypothetical protein
LVRVVGVAASAKTWGLGVDSASDERSLATAPSVPGMGLN